MAILLDYSQVSIANIMVFLNGNKHINEDMIRHMIINSIRSYYTQFRARYGELIICVDSKKLWRKEYFQFYKAHRKKDRDESPLDWNLIFSVIAQIKEDLRENFPYKVIEVDGAEGDDVIAVLAARLAANEDVLILSSDHDFAQLQKYKRVSQYSPILKRFIDVEDPIIALKEHIIRGDRGDGIPNLLSKDSVFVQGERQKPISAKKLDIWLNQNPEEFCNMDMMRNWDRNEMLIDFSRIPLGIQDSIINKYDETKPSSKQKMLNFLIEKRMTNLIQVASDF